MTALHLGPRGPIGPLANGGFEVSYVPDDGAERRVPLAHLWPAPRRLSTGCGGSAIRNVELAVIAQRQVQEAVRRAHAHHRDS